MLTGKKCSGQKSGRLILRFFLHFTAPLDDIYLDRHEPGNPDEFVPDEQPVLERSLVDGNDHEDAIQQGLDNISSTNQRPAADPASLEPHHEFN